MANTSNKLPHWDLSNVFPGLDSPEFGESYQHVVALLDDFEDYLERNKIEGTSAQRENGDTAILSARISGVIELLNEIYRLLNTLENFLKSYTTTDSFNTDAKQHYSQVQTQLVRADQTKSVVSGWLGGLGDELPKIIATNPTAGEHAFFLQESAEQSKYLMNAAEESLAKDLSLSGIRAWGILQGTITSQLASDFKLDGEVQSLPLPALQNIRRYNPNPEIRESAFKAEIEALKSVREPLAACMNGVKGFVNVLNHRRYREDALHPSLDQARIDRETLEAMMSAMQASFPTFRRYLKA